MGIVMGANSQPLGSCYTYTSVIETIKRLLVLYRISRELDVLGVAGLLSVGSMAWGKFVAVSKSSDIDIYIVADAATLHRVINRCKSLLPARATLAPLLETFLRYRDELSLDMLSAKIPLGGFPPSTVFLVPEDSFQRLCNQSIPGVEAGDFEILMANLRPSYLPQRKVYSSFDSSKLEYETHFESEIETIRPFRIRRDLFALSKGNRLYGGIFLSHMLSAEVLIDRNDVARNMSRIGLSCVSRLLDEYPEGSTQVNRIANIAGFFDRLPSLQRVGPRSSLRACVRLRDTLESYLNVRRL